MGTTKGNLEFAFAGESQANRKYLFFADKAEQEGHPQVAKLFRAAADAETVHARNHLEVLGGIKSTNDNLVAAMEGENHEFTEMYPGFMAQAGAEGERQARLSFDLANKVEKIHHELYKGALATVEQGVDMEAQPIYVCQRCGNTVEGEPPYRCPICGVPRNRFKLIE